MSKKIGNIYGMENSYVKLGDIFTETGELNKAVKYLKKAYASAKAVNHQYVLY